jgi:hypothetical protein
MTLYQLDISADDLQDEIARHEVSLADYLADVEVFVRRYIAWPSDHEPAAVALWVAHCYLVDGYEASPLLAVTSAEMRSGKTRVLEVLELLVPNPWRCVIPSEAVTYTVLSRLPRPTLLLDEADAIFGTRDAARYEGLRAILNSGNRRGSPVLRVKLDGKRREVDAFDVFGPKAIAGIGKLPDTVTDRAIPIRMKRRAPGEQVERFRTRFARESAETIAQPDWRTHVAVVADALTGVEIPDALNDRAADAWEPLLAIAEVAGDGWPARARTAALALSTGDDGMVTSGIRLLRDIRSVFETRHADHFSTSELLTELVAVEDGTWAEWYGKALTAKGLARLLEPYGIRPQKRRTEGGSDMRGYWLQDFVDTFERYLADGAPVDGSATSATTVLGEREDLLEQATAWRFGTHPEPLA